MKIHFILSSACMVACAIAVEAVPTLRLLHDEANLTIEILASGPDVLSPNRWTAEYRGPVISSAGSSVDISTRALATFEVPTFPSSSLEQPVLDTALYTALARVLEGSTWAGSGAFTGIASTFADNGGPQLNGEWYARASVELLWEFAVEGANGTGTVFAERDGGGYAGYSITDLTAGQQVASFATAPFLEEANSTTWNLIDGHIYRLNTYARTEDFGRGDPFAQFVVQFSGAAIVQTPETGPTLLTLGISLASLMIFKARCFRLHRNE